MIINTLNYKSLLTNNLTRDDIINFNFSDISFQYIVRNRWLEPMHGARYETEIIDYLIKRNFISISCYDFCSQCYGYPAREHDSSETWPDCRDEDFKAMSRLVYTIFELIINIDSQVKKVSLTSLNKISFL